MKEMGKKTIVHIVPHAHWDREWYLPLEHHRARLLRQMDAVLNLLEQDSAYTYHLDGQMIAVEDYLRFRPEREADIRRFCEQGRLRLGPWYVLQDEYLTCGEANVQNLLFGMERAKRFGIVTKIGYLPDAFGNVSQMPQLCRQSGMIAAVFGRGVTLCDTEPDAEAHFPRYSEFLWQSPDGSTVSAVYFSDWYNNAQEIPTDPIKAKPYWDMRLARAKRFASSRHLLFMNGSDHQPVQKNLAEAIAVARKLYPEIEFRYSDLETFAECVRLDRISKPETVTGELVGQESAGDNTLCNTASSRALIKVLNRKAESMLWGTAEPLVVMAEAAGWKPDGALRREAWRLVVENHPHDSICGCGIDAVHRETVYRYEKSLALSELLTEQAAQALSQKIQKPKDAKAAFAVYNSSAWPRRQAVTVTAAAERIYGTREAYLTLQNQPNEKLVLTDAAGKPVYAVIEDCGVRFGFDLPEDRFRQAYFERQYRVTFSADLPACGYAVYALKTGAPQTGAGMRTGETAMENNCVSVAIRPNGTFDLTDKATGRVYTDLGLLEDVGDVGDEYIFREATDGKVTSEYAYAAITCIEDVPCRTTFRIETVLRVPASADAALWTAQAGMEPCRMRKIGRSSDRTDLIVETMLSIEPDSPLVRMQVRIRNTVRDHRLRMLFPTDFATDTHLADSVFDAILRTDVPGPYWTNPSRCQRMQTFVACENKTVGLAVLNRGMYEYEILPDRKTMAITLLRSVGEMGDWGVFPTPEAQCLGTVEQTLGILPYANDAFLQNGCREAIQFQTDPVAAGIRETDGTLPMQGSLFRIEGAAAVTACKPSEDETAWILRGVNPTADETVWTLHLPKGCGAYESDILEQKGKRIHMDAAGIAAIPVRGKEIKTVRIETD